MVPVMVVLFLPGDVHATFLPRRVLDLALSWPSMVRIIWRSDLRRLLPRKLTMTAFMDVLRQACFLKLVPQTFVSSQGSLANL